MKMFRLLTAVWALLFCLISVGCNRPLPAATQSIAIPSIPYQDSLLLTRTVLAQQIEDTLTAIAATAGYAIEQTAESPIVRTVVVEKITAEINYPTLTAPALISEGVTTLVIPIVIIDGVTPDVGNAPQIEITPSPIQLSQIVTPEAVTTPLPPTPESTPIATTSEQPVSSASPTGETPVAAETPVPEPVEYASPAMLVPEVYTLHRGEFPWCLARRYNISPQQIMCLNGFYPGQTFYAGQPVYLPLDPIPFPGKRALRPHPARYVVGFGDTIYSVACFFGNVDPMILAAVNDIQPPYRLRPGQVLEVP